jgi:hypothetical protein
MKIVIDKIEAHPPHAFSPPELRAFLRLLPAELLRDVALVRLSSAIEHSAARYLARFSRHERRLVIISRGVSRDDAMLEVSRCLIRANLRRPASYGGGTLSLLTADVDAAAKDVFMRVSPLMPVAPRWSRVQLKYLSLQKRDPIQSSSTLG